MSNRGRCLDGRASGRLVLSPDLGATMQPLILLAVALVGFTVNFAWDRTVRRRRAQALRDTRRQARPRALPPALADEERERRMPDPQVRIFVERTRAIFAELDELIDRFDLLLLRARDRARWGMVVVRAEAPRRAACTLLHEWLGAHAQLDAETRAHLETFGLGPRTVAEVLERERVRASWEFRSDVAEVLADTTKDLDRAVIHMQEIVRLLESDDADPYR